MLDKSSKTITSNKETEEMSPCKGANSSILGNKTCIDYVDEPQMKETCQMVGMTIHPEIGIKNEHIPNSLIMCTTSKRCRIWKPTTRYGCTKHTISGLPKTQS